MVTAEETVPQFSGGYRYARSAFFVQFNEVDFYIEDAWQENLYFSILSALFPRLKLENIHPLGGKGNIIKHATSNASVRKSVYVLDKDFDDLLGKVHTQANVFYLEKYCIENFLIEEEALVRFIISEKPRLKAEAVRDQLKFQGLSDDLIAQLARLFALFFIAQRYNVALKSTSHAPDCFCSAKDGCCVDQEKVSGFLKTLRKMAEKQNCEINVDQEFEFYSEDFELKKKRDLRGRNVSGEFMLYLGANRIAKMFELKHVPDMHSFAFRLAERCGFRSLTPLKRQINAYLSA